ncbi:MAG: amidohydrolase [Chloroflexi bacterium]|nr:amidohydrolase [Chloroflexota bacterium]
MEIGSNINGRDLDSPELIPFYKEVENQDIPVFIHPVGVAGLAGDESMRKYQLGTLIGIPTDTAIAAAHLIFGDVLEKFPRLKFYLPHGGGSLPCLIGRWDHGYQMRAECKEIIKQPPGSYLSLLYFDTITHSGPALEYLIDLVGVDKVMMGSDYPANGADKHPVSSIQSLKSVTDEGKQQIMGGNAARLLKL